MQLVNWPDHMKFIYMCSLMRALQVKAGGLTRHCHFISHWLLGIQSLNHCGILLFLQSLEVVLLLHWNTCPFFRTKTDLQSVNSGGENWSFVYFFIFFCRTLTLAGRKYLKVAHSPYGFPATHLSGPKPTWMRVALYLWAAVSCPWLCEVRRTKCSPSPDETLVRGGWVSPTILR